MKQNRHIGRNLYLHPVNIVGGVWKEDIKPWEGESKYLLAYSSTCLILSRWYINNCLYNF